MIVLVHFGFDSFDRRHAFSAAAHEHDTLHDVVRVVVARDAEARQMAGTLLPEIMSYDPTRPASFPSSGRTLTDDAGDAFVAVLTNGKVTKDGVGPHSDLLAEFPYLGPPLNRRD